MRSHLIDPKTLRIFCRLTCAILLWSGCSVVLRAQSPPPEDFSRLLPGISGLGIASSPVDAAIRQKQYGRAERLLYAQIQKNPGSAALLQRIGGVFFLDRRYLNTAIALKKAEALAPLDPRHRFLLAMSYVLMRHEDWARPELEKLTAEQPKQALYPYWLARLDFARRRYPQALGEVKRALVLNPAYANAWDLQGLCNYSIGNYSAAVQSYEKAVEANRRGARSPWPPLDFGSLLLKLGRLPEAGAVLREAVQYDPRLAGAHEQLGLVQEKQHHPHDAISELSKAAQLAPKDPAPHYALARIYRNQGETSAAVRESAIFTKLRQLRDQESAPKLER